MKKILAIFLSAAVCLGIMASCESKKRSEFSGAVSELGFKPAAVKTQWISLYEKEPSESDDGQEMYDVTQPVIGDRNQGFWFTTRQYTPGCRNVYRQKTFFEMEKTLLPIFAYELCPAEDELYWIGCEPDGDAVLRLWKTDLKTMENTVVYTPKDGTVFAADSLTETSQRGKDFFLWSEYAKTGEGGKASDTFTVMALNIVSGEITPLFEQKTEISRYCPPVICNGHIAYVQEDADGKKMLVGMNLESRETVELLALDKNTDAAAFDGTRLAVVLDGKLYTKSLDEKELTSIPEAQGVRDCYVFDGLLIFCGDGEEQQSAVFLYDTRVARTIFSSENCEGPEGKASFLQTRWDPWYECLWVRTDKPTENYAVLVTVN